MPSTWTPPVRYDWLAAAAQDAPTALALLDSETGQAWTYALLNEDVAELAAHLHGLGVGKGARVAALMPNSIAYALLAFALMRLNAVLVPLNARLTADELAYQVTTAGCGWLMVDQTLAERAAAVDGAVVRLKVDVRRTRFNAPLMDYRSGLEVSAWRKGVFDRYTPGAVIFTSGTSGRPKGAVLSFDNLYQNAMASALRLGNPPGDRWLLTLPLYHVGGLTMLYRAMVCRAAVVIIDYGDAEALERALREAEVTLVSLVPTQLYRRLRSTHGRPFPPSVRLVLVGGAPADPELVHEALDRGVPLALTYGLTEACSQVATALPDEVWAKAGTVGRALPFMRLRVVGPDGEDAAPGEIGEVVIQGRMVMAGYLTADADAALAIPNKAPFATGDLGYLDEDGDLFLVQRRSDLIVSGGENVYPAEVERALRAHPAVVEAAVVGLPSAEWGQQVAAVVVTDAPPADEAALWAQLTAHLRGRLAGYKLPRVWKLAGSLPQTSSGKVDRAGVRALFG